MFLLFPKKYSVKTSLTPSQCRKKLNREIVDYTRKPSLIAANRFIKNHRMECCYYGSFDKTGRVEIFYHHAKKHDGASAGFFGRIEKADGGSVITGKIRRTAAVTVTVTIWFALLALLILALAALKIYDGAICTAILMITGGALMTYDGSEAYLRSYLNTFEEPPREA